MTYIRRSVACHIATVVLLNEFKLLTGCLLFFAAMRASLIAVDDISPCLVEAWRDLASSSVELNPFHEPDMVLAASRHLARPDNLALAAVWSGNRLHACLPVCSSRYWQRLPLTSLRTWRHKYCYLGTPLLHREKPAAAAGALLDLLFSARRGRLLVFPHCAVDGPVHTALRQAAVSRRTRIHEDWCFERAVARTADPFRVALRGKHLKDLRRFRRHLEADLGAPLVLKDRPADTDTIGNFLKLEASGWKGGNGTALACRDEDFFREVCERFGRDDRVRFASLESNDQAVAMLCIIRSSHEFYWFKTGFDEHYADASPGRQLMLDVTAALEDAPTETVHDSCADPLNETINRLWAGRRRFANLLIPVPGVSRLPTDILAAESARRHEGNGQSHGTADDA